MSLRLDVYLHVINSGEVKLDAVLAKLTQLEAKMVQELDDLIAQVTRNTEVEQSALVLIQGFAGRLQAAIDAALAAGATPAMLASLTEEVKRLTATAEPLAAAVAANTGA
jgi:hypothetical protein